MNQNYEDHLENQLRSWKPLDPSARLRNNVIGSCDGLNAAISPPLAPTLTAINPRDALREWLQPLSRWIAPAFACFLATLVPSTWRSPDLAGESTRPSAGILALAAYTNQSLAAYLPATGAVEHNGLPTGLNLAQK